ncbi:hypothetical protein F5Y05DRAFT_408401 [Hypoxylon sp. FL0543]|nr:hypothetical protein F5Y05DRAFT_408401 [Hypoxylon sp. FL0543]
MASQERLRNFNPVTKMVNGLERLERFFGGSRKRDREGGTRRRDVSPSQLQNGQHFPSPSFIFPTTKHMKPREEAIPWSRADKERSQSLPDPHIHLRRRSSIGSTSNLSNHKYYPSDPLRPLSFSTKKTEGLPGNQRLSRFRFPEDPLANIQDAGTSSTGRISNETGQEHDAEKPGAENILDWSPQRISSLFNNLGLETSIDSRLAKYSGGTEILALRAPSTVLSAPPSPKTTTNITPIVIPPRGSSRQANESPVPDLTILRKIRTPLPLSIPSPDSPPASDGEEECSRTSLSQPMPIKALGSPIELTPRPSFEFVSRGQTEILTRKHSARESWGMRVQDPALGCTALDESSPRHCVTSSQVLRKSASISSFSTITVYVPDVGELREPTVDDFYALSDEDVLEKMPATPKPEADIPPTPPPKNISPHTPIGRSRSTRHVPIAPTAAIDFSSGELTPPQTPTHSQFLTLTYSPTNASGELGALWTANIAKKYNFDLVYVISLWPKGRGNNSDPSRRPTLKGYRQSEAQNKDHVSSSCAIVANSKSGMTGRLLAAYGLNDFGSPFRVHAQFHRKMLGFKGWKEYRDELASPGMISRGWTCSFYSDHTQTIQNGIGGKPVSRGGIVNRGIVFAAYTRKTTKSMIPVTASPKQTAILGKLYYDAQTLVDALVHGT